MGNSSGAPIAFFNSKIEFNPYQYEPIKKINALYDDKTRDLCGGFEWNGRNLLITDEVGVGKTFEAGIILQEFKRMLENDSGIRGLVLCPVKLVSGWCEALHRFFDFSVSDYQNSKQLAEITVVPYSFFSHSDNSQKSKEKISEEMLEKEEQGFKEEKWKPGEELDNETKKRISKLTEDDYFDVIILDEAHYIRNAGKLFHCVQMLIENNQKKKSNEELKIFMTGTPVFNSETDYKNITQLLGKFETTKTLQCESNCYDNLLKIEVCNYVYNEIERKIVNENIFSRDENGKTAFGKLTGFLKRLSSSSFSSLKKFVDELRNPNSDIPNVISTFSEGNFDNNDDNDEEDNDNDNSVDVLKNNLGDLAGSLEEWEKGEDEKLNILVKNLRPIVENENCSKGETPKAIIFACFIHTADYLEKQLGSRLPNCRVLKINGSMNRKQVEDIKHRFAEDGTPAVLICTDAAKEGHNLQFCQHLFHYDLPYTPAAIGQRNGRIYRMGQKGEPKAYYLLAEGGYDDRLFGEIIVNKCNVVKEFAEQGLLSELNILPGDANYIKKKYISSYLNDLSLKQLRSLLYKKFGPFNSNENGFNPTSDGENTLKETAERFYKQSKPDNETLDISFCTKCIKDFLKSNLNKQGDNFNRETLRKSFQTNYDELTKEFLLKYFGVGLSEESDIVALIDKARRGEEII